jgi:hypothetical protein
MAVDTIELKLEEIAYALEQLLDVCRKRGLSQIEVPHLTYWSVDAEDSFNTLLNQPPLLLGDIFDDAQSVKAISKDKDGLAGLHLSNIAALLNYLGSKYPSLGPQPIASPTSSS